MTFGRPDFQLALIKLKRPSAVVAVVAFVAGGGFYAHQRKESLREQGIPQVKGYLRTELPARLIRVHGAGRVPPENLEAVRQLEIVEFATQWLPFDKTRVRVEVTTPIKDFTYHFTFKRRFGRWVLDSEAAAGVLSP